MFTIDKRDFHASAFILGPNNTTVLIRDMRKENPLWKFPGGKKKLVKPFGKNRREEKPIETVLREVWEETGLRLKRSQTEHVATFDKGNHNKHLFFSKLHSFSKLKPLSDEYEEAEIFSVEDLYWLGNFHSAYRHSFLSHITPLIET